MSGKPLTLAERATRAATREAPSRAAEEPPLLPAPRVEPVRITVDMSPVAYQRLDDACRALAVSLQVVKVPLASVIRALVAALDRDPELAGQIREDVRRDVEENRRRK